MSIKEVIEVSYETINELQYSTTILCDGSFSLCAFHGSRVKWFNEAPVLLKRVSNKCPAIMFAINLDC